MSLSSSHRAPDQQLLLEHAAWVHALARSLVRDRHLADDVAQETCVAALEHAPADGGDVRGWLAHVLRNFHLQALRGEGRRRARERSAARPEAQPSAHDVLARAALHRELVEAVLALEEPFRTVVLLRFFDELQPRVIAAQLDVPVATVNSRLQRGLERLRASFDRRRGAERESWIVALLPLVQQHPPLPTAAGPSTILAALLMDTKIKLAVLLACAVCGIAVVRYLSTATPGASESRTASTELGAPASPSEPAPAEKQGLALDATTGERLVAAQTAARATLAQPSPAGALLRGRVLDASSRPLAGVALAFASSTVAGGARPSLTESTASGSFELAAPSSAVQLVAASERFATVMAGVYRPGSSIEPVVVVAPRIELAGRVSDEDGRPLERARIELRLRSDFATRFAHVLDASIPFACKAVSDARGRFELPDAFNADGAELVTSFDGRTSDVREVPSSSDRALDIVLRTPVLDAHALRGDVRAADGAPVEGARVAFGLRTLATGADGAFEFALEDEAPADTVTAVKRGLLPASFKAPIEGARARWPEFVRLRLSEPSRALAGRVRDEHGDGLAHIRVWLADPTFFGMVDDSPTHLESLIAGAMSRPEFERLRAQQPAGSDPSALVENTPTQRWYWTETDAHGRFRLEGLLAQEYRIKALDPLNLNQIEVGPFEAGSEDLELVLSQAQCHERVVGRVLSQAGHPIAGVRVRVTRKVIAVTLRNKHGTSESSRSASGATSLSDADGRFTLERVPRAGVFLTFASDAIVPTWHDLAPDDDVAHLDVHASLRCHLQVELDPPVDRADRFRVLDAQGRALPLSMIRDGDEDSDESQPLLAGRSAVFALAEGARTLVLLKNGLEVAREPLEIVPERINIVRR